MDAFFASVEQVRDPSLAGKPLIIGGEKTDTRSVVSTASYEARVFGVHSAMPIVQARRLCPHGIFMRGNHALYGAASRQVRAILEMVSPLVQMASIDEAYIDVTGSQKLFGGDDGIAHYIKDTIRKETGLPCTIAIAPNKLVAKVASGEAKPDGYRRIAAGEEAAFLAPLAVRKLPGAGPKTCVVLERLDIHTIGQLAAMPLPALERAFGNGAHTLHKAAMGEGYSEVEVGALPKSVSRETTFGQDELDWNRIEQMIAYLTERAAYALREDGLEAKRVTLKVRYADFETKTFAKALPLPTSVDHAFHAALKELLPKAKARRARVRLIGVNLGALSHGQHQLQLFEEKHDEKWEQVLTQVDQLRNKLGFESLRFGKSMGLSRTKDKRGGGG
jgi:DNA polymerase-4